MTPEDFIAKWRGTTRTERSAAQEHFLDLCRLLDVPTPGEVDRHGTEYTFEKTTRKIGGKAGFADVWRKHCFAWEYKGKQRNLVKAYAQLKLYADAFENPPLLIVSDMQEIRVHTNFTNTVAQQHVIALADLRSVEHRALLRNCFLHPERLLPTESRESVTARAAAKFANIAVLLREQYDERRVAHFINKLVFCLFAEDIELLPDRVFADILDEAVKRPDDFVPMLRDLFRAMANKNGRFGKAAIPWFNGGLFDDDDVLPLGMVAVRDLVAAARLDWKAIDPTIFGTLFESGLDDKKRAEMASLFDVPDAVDGKQARLFDRSAADKGVGIHYTDVATIMKIIDPAVMAPLSREWETIKGEMREMEERRARARSSPAKNELLAKARQLYGDFRVRLGRFRVLDPACGSGNFLALALRALKDFDLLVMKEAAALQLPPDKQRVGPEAVLGIEINRYAAELARLTVWITELQWQLRNNFELTRRPILDKLEGIARGDALLAGTGKEVTWPSADVIIGNPPFLGDRFHRRELGDRYTEMLRAAYHRRVPGRADLVVYWIEKARELLDRGEIKRFGLVATKSIAKGASRRPLERICDSENLAIFAAWTNEPWVLRGALVRVSIVCAGRKSDPTLGERRLNGKFVQAIAADLTEAGTTGGIARVKPLKANAGVAFQGVKLTGSFDIDGDAARRMLAAPPNPNGRPNSDVIRRLWDIDDVTGRPSDRWVIDFGPRMAEGKACLYELPFERVKKTVPSERKNIRETRVRDQFWIFQRPRPELRKAIGSLTRYIVTPETSEYRLFVWADARVLIVGSIFAIARDDDTTFGILQSRFHEAWATAAGNRLGVGNQRRYNITVTFKTFPFPEGLTPNLPAVSYADEPSAVAIAAAARRLDDLRNAWLNPPDLIRIESEVAPGFPNRVLPRDGDAARELKTRTLTKLYNERPTWLANSHRDLDAAVAAAYGWPADIAEDDALARLLALNRERSGESRETASREKDDVRFAETSSKEAPDLPPARQ
jgi:type II restriction/modification system DNA methylase subunit YeeA